MTTITTNIKNPERVRVKHEQIFDAALSLVKKKGFNKMTLRDISKETRMSLGNLYDYIGSKDDILFLIHQKAAKIFEANIDSSGWKDAPPLEKLRKIIEVEFDSKVVCQDLVMLMYQESHELPKEALRNVLGLEEKRITVFEEVVRESIDAGLLRPVNPVVIAHFIITLIDGWVLRRWSIHKKVTADEMKKSIMDMIFSYVLDGAREGA
ncbi:MAG: TetR/AcrR family transcriptional regulator [Alphaproteobacteria bacterium]|nr:TetR/AcrR family transcriptional regulator [Alphaproteobacteria bacterium]